MKIRTAILSGLMLTTTMVGAAQAHPHNQNQGSHWKSGPSQHYTPGRAHNGQFQHHTPGKAHNGPAVTHKPAIDTQRHGWNKGKYPYKPKFYRVKHGDNLHRVARKTGGSACAS